MVMGGGGGGSGCKVERRPKRGKGMHVGFFCFGTEGRGIFGFTCGVGDRERREETKLGGYKGRGEATVANNKENGGRITYD